MRVLAVIATALVASVAAGPSFSPDVDVDAQRARLERRVTLEKRAAAKVRHCFHQAEWIVLVCDD